METAAHRLTRVGDRIRVRRERWRVSGVEDGDDCRTLTLDGLGPRNIHEQRTLLEPFERIESLSPGTAPMERSPAAWPSGRRRWRRVCRGLLADAGPWARLRAADRADIDVMPHQLVPALAVLRGRATRVLLADAVGLGKTVQAAVLLSELTDRGAVDSALILAPAGLRDQWQQELQTRFRLNPDLVDLRAAARLTRALPLGVNPWMTRRLAIASLDYIKRPEVLAAARARPWDLVVVDEAHLVAPGSERYTAVAHLCATAVFVVLLTATPHSGDREAFSALRALGALRDDPADSCLVFRRSRAEIHIPGRRHVHQLQIRPSPAEWRMHAALDRYAAAIGADGQDERSGELLVATLRKRALSSPASLRTSVERRLHRVAGPGQPDAAQLSLALDDGHGEFDVSDDVPLLDVPALRDRVRERSLLERLAGAATAACRGETKLTSLAGLLRRLARRREPVIVFTEYRDTLLHVQRHVAPDALVLHGGMERGERRRVVEAFTGGSHAVLLATDAAGEGLNLHHACRCVVHLELPWNPVRLEQRTGRVDRIGQRRTVHAFCLVSRHRAEAAMLQRLRARVASADEDIGMASPLESARPGGASGRPQTAADPDVRDISDAGIEARRIRRARALRRRTGTSRGRCLDPDPAFGVVARARGPIRTLLQGRPLLLVGLNATDGTGRSMASAVTPLLLPTLGRHASSSATDGRRRISASASGIVGSLDGISATCIPDFRERDPSFAEHASFWSAARARARIIADASMPAAGGLFQPGLFDRRAAQVHQLRLDEEQALARLTTARVARYAAALDPPSVFVERLLLLLP